MSVSMRGGLSFLNMRVGSGPRGALRYGDRAPGEGLRERGDVLAAGAHLHGQVLRTKAGRQGYRLLEVLVVAEVIGHIGGIASRQRGAVERLRLAGLFLPVHGQADGSARHAIGLAGADQRDVDEVVPGRLGGGQTHRPDAYTNL